MSRLESILAVVEEGIHLLSCGDQCSPCFSTELQVLSVMWQECERLLRQIVYGYNECTVPPIGRGNQVIKSGCIGRPCVAVNIHHVEFLRKSGCTWDEVASVLGLSRSTIWRRLRNIGIQFDKYTDISDSQLDDAVKRVQQQHPNVGQVMLQGFLKQQGICIQRYREYCQM